MLLRFHARLAPDGTGRMSTTRYSYKIRYKSRYYSVKVNFKFKSKFKLKFISKTQLQRQRQRYRERDIKRVIHTESKCEREGDRVCLTEREREKHVGARRKLPAAMFGRNTQKP